MQRIAKDFELYVKFRKIKCAIKCGAAEKWHEELKKTRIGRSETAEHLRR